MRKIAIVALFAASAFAAEWKGTISDAKCGAAHADASEKSMKCSQACVKGGQAAVFVSDGKVLKIANQDKIAAHVGHRGTLTGKIEGDTVTVEDFKMD
jgi:hypothetical protein